MSLNRVCGIYVIQNIITNEYYGGSSVNIYTRWKYHLYNATSGKYKNSHLYNAMRKYGIEQFVMYPILFCDINNLIMYEQQWIDANFLNLKCYNMSNVAGSRIGVKQPPGFSEYISNCLKGRTSPMKGRNHSKESKEKIGNASRGKILSDDTKNKIRLSHIGKKFSKESIEKMKISHLGKSPSNKGIGKVLNPDKVSDIRSMYKSGKYTQLKLAIQFGCSRSTVQGIVNNTIWKD